MEIEKKFTIKELPNDLDKYPSHVIEQGYLLRGVGGPVLRVRKKDEDYILTYKLKQKKGGEGAPIINIEEEFPLNEEGYNKLLDKCEGNIISKIRYLIPVGDGLTGELDVFQKSLYGLYFIEVEFKTEKQANEFVMPEWFKEDVTGNGAFSNGYLTSISSFDEWLVKNKDFTF